MRKTLLFLFFVAGCAQPIPPVPVPDMTEQESIDKFGTLTIPVNTTVTLKTPLFVGNNTIIHGENRYTSKIDCRPAGHGIVIGWPRGRVSDDHYVNGGFRTRGDALPIDIGGELSLGPLAPGKSGYRGVKAFKLSMTVTKHFAERWDAKHVILAGIQNADVVWGGVARPEPILCYIQAGKARLSYRTRAGDVSEVAIPIDTTAETITLDFPEIVVDGLYQNSRWPFGLGMAPPTPGTLGYWGCGGWAKILDMTFTRFELTLDGVTWKSPWTRPTTYVGGLSLPLLNMTGAGTYTRSVLVYHTSQGVTDNVGNVGIENLTIQGFSGHAIINAGASMGAVRIRDCELIGGSRAVQSLSNWVHYPLTIRDCHFYYQSDCNAHFVNTSGLLFDSCQLDYGPRCAIETWNCNGEIRGPMMMAPPGPPAQDSPFIQHGGQMIYRGVIVDYEYKPASYAFLNLQSGSWLSPSFVTTVKMENCYSGLSTVAVKVGAAQTGYTAKTVVELSGGTGKDRRIQIGGKITQLANGATLAW